MKMKYTYFLLFIAAVFTVSSCSYNRHSNSPFHDPNNSGYEYAPAMYHSWAYEPLSQVTDPDATSWHKNSMPHNDFNGEENGNVITPVAGTIARGKLDYYVEFENNDAGRAKAAAELENTVELNDFTLMEGKRLYNLYCDHCHGEQGDGKGSIVSAEKFPSPGEYYGKLKDLEAGSIYHTIIYGKGQMGSHASQLSPEQRWKIVHWVQTLQLSDKAFEVTTVAEKQALSGSGEATEDSETAEDGPGEEAPNADEAVSETEVHDTAEDSSEGDHS